MKQEEIEILGLKKLVEGKSYKQIKQEINNIDSFGKQIKTDKKVIEKQYKEIQKLKEQLKIQKKKVFNLSLTKQTNELTLSELKKINYLIKSNHGLLKQDIKSSCDLEESKVVTALSFLKRNKLIEEKNKNGTKYYV